MRQDPSAILNQLALLESDQPPTLGFLLSAIPELRCADWLNRWGPIRAWDGMLSEFTTPQLAYLAKAITVLERDLNWLGGSVAATMWIYRAYEARPDGDADALADWILSNKGRNPYVPFGRSSSARTLLEYRCECEQRRRRKLEHVEREALQRQRKQERVSEAQQRALLRRIEGEQRARRLAAYLKDLLAMRDQDRLQFLAFDHSFPLEAVPEDLITKDVDAIGGLSAEARDALLTRLDRRKARRWKKIYKALKA
jgi:hypothetical protein